MKLAQRNTYQGVTLDRIVWAMAGAGGAGAVPALLVSRRLAADRNLADLVRRLTPYDPERIILFGSRARGDADEHSDYDLVVVKRTDRPFVERLQEVAGYLAGYAGAADVLVYTPDELEQMSEQGLGWMIHQEGIVVYEKPAA